MRSIKLALLVVLSFGTLPLSAGSAQIAILEPFYTAPTVKTSIANALIIKNRAQWSSIFIFLKQIDPKVKEKNRFCTATLIGPNVFLTAAHCVKGVSKIFIEFGSNPEVTCTAHPDYAKATQPSLDYALCISSQDITKLDSKRIFRPEILLTKDHSFSEEFGLMMIVGAGCNKIDFSRLKNAEVTVGFTRIIRLPTQASHWRNFIVGSADLSGYANSVLCPGDSGGPTFYNSYYEDVLKASADPDHLGNMTRVLIGVNSGTLLDEEALQKSLFGHSFIASTRTADFRKFLDSWLDKNKEKYPVVCVEGGSLHATCNK